MKGKARLLYKSYNSCFQTSLPVYFYGMPGGKMMVLFSRKKEDFYLKRNFEWVLAVHLDFWFDYDAGVIMDFKNREVGLEEFMELTDKLEQRINPVKIFGSFSGSGDALQFINENTFHMLISPKPRRAVLNY